MIEVFIEELTVNEIEASEIIDKVFPELRNLKPIPTKTTLRSHTTALWFRVLGVLSKKKSSAQPQNSRCFKSPSKTTEFQTIKEIEY